MVLDVLLPREVHIDLVAPREGSFLLNMASKKATSSISGKVSSIPHEVYPELEPRDIAFHALRPDSLQSICFTAHPSLLPHRAMESFLRDRGSGIALCFCFDS